MRGTRKERKKERKKGRDPFGRYILYFAGEAETRDDSREARSGRTTGNADNFLIITVDGEFQIY